MRANPEATENYLKQIYALALDDSPVKTSQIAEALKVSPAAVTEMLKRLETQHLVEYRPYHGVALTQQGTQWALSVIRKHRLWEVFLFQVLGIPWSQVHDHACRLEHATDDSLVEKLDQHLGHPTIDPHGDPIPSSDGNIQEIDRLRLSTLEPGTSAFISQCTNENPQLLAYLKSMDIIPGTEIKVNEKAPFNGPMTISVNNQQRIIGIEVAQTLIVQPIFS